MQQQQQKEANCMAMCGHPENTMTDKGLDMIEQDLPDGGKFRVSSQFYILN